MFKYMWWDEDTESQFPELTPLYLIAAVIYHVRDFFGLNIPDWVWNQILIPLY